MGGTEGVAVEDLEKLASSAIGGKRVCGGLVAVEPVITVLVCGKLSSQVVWLLVLRVLEVVLSVRARLPDVDDGVGDALLGVEVDDPAVHKSSLAIGVRVSDDGVTKVAEWGVWRPEGAENCRGGGCLARLVDVLVCDLID